MLLSQDGIRRKALHKLVRQARQKVRYPSQWCATGQKPTPGRNPVIVLPVMLPWQAFGLAQFFIPVVMLVLWVIEPLLWPPAQRPHGPGSPGSHGDVPGCSAGATPLFSLDRPPKTKPIFVEALSPKPGAEGLHTSVVCRLVECKDANYSTTKSRLLAGYCVAVFVSRNESSDRLLALSVGLPGRLKSRSTSFRYAQLLRLEPVDQSIQG